jgi:hypothetical protein
LIVSKPIPETLPDDVPEADWAEQEVDADPLTDEAGEPGSRSDIDPRSLVEANEADVAEQETLAYGESDESRD